MVAKREICVTTDPYAYDETLIDNYVITRGYASGVDESATGDYIRYPAGSGLSNSPSFVTLRVQAHTDSANRETIKEEATDQVAAASIFGGVYNVSGSFNGAFRGWDFHLSGLLQGIMGEQTATTAPTLANQAAAGKRYELEMVPKALAVKIVDEQAKNADGTRGTTTVYRGVGISSFELTMAAKQYAQFTCQWMARQAEVYDAPYNTNSEPNGDPSLFYNTVLKWTPRDGSGVLGTTTSFKCFQFSMNVSRTIDTDAYMIGSEFLYDLIYNGMTNLGGQITLAPSDWDKIRAMIAGSTDDTINKLDQGKREYFGVVNADPALSTVLANDIPAGKFEILMHTPNGQRIVTAITCDTAKLLSMTRDAQGRQRINKTLNWEAVINNTYNFYVDVYPAST